jgi:Arm DNA-binding domain
MHSMTKRVRLSDAIVARLPFTANGQLIVRDEELPGFFVLIGRRTKTYSIQGTLPKRHGRRQTLRLAIGRHDDPGMNARAARARAREWLGRIARGENPSEPKRGNQGPSLREAWGQYQQRLRKREREDSTIADYRDNIERVLKDWLDVPLMEIGRDPRLVIDLHEKLTKQRGPYAANRAMRVLRAVYNHAQKYAPELRGMNPVSIVEFNPEKRRDTGMGKEDLSAWHRQLMRLPNPVRREFHLFMLLSGSRPDALSKARWEHLDLSRGALHIQSPRAVRSGRLISHSRAK